MGGGADGDENRDLGVDLDRIEQRHAPADDAVFFHLLDTPPTGRRGKADLFRQIGNGQRGILLQNAQNLTV
ncbi:hypothetical protein D3C87_1132690 [compost metagenome]